MAKDGTAYLPPLAAANGFVQSWPHLINGSFDSQESAQNSVSISSAVFAQHIRVTYKETLLCVTRVATGRIVCTACRRCSIKIYNITTVNVHTEIPICALTNYDFVAGKHYVSYNHIEWATAIWKRCPCPLPQTALNQRWARDVKPRDRDETETWRLSRDVIETSNNCGNVTMKRVCQCLKLSSEYLKLLDKHNCGPRDNAYKIRRYVYSHFVLQTGV